jgi:hypothetical protein
MTSILFLLLIYGGHMYWNYIVNRYSKKKVKDVISPQIEKYKRIVEELQKNQSESVPYISEPERHTMEETLTVFANQLSA